MLTADGCRRRRARLRNELPQQPDWILLHSPRNLTYFANYYASPFLFRSQNSGAMLLLGADGSSLLIADNLLEPFAERSHVDRVEMPTWYRSRESAPRRDDLLIRTTVDVLRNTSGSVLGVDAAVPAAVLEAIRHDRPGLYLLDVGETVHRLMRSKDADEVAVMRRCVAAAEAGFASALVGITPGMTEMDAFELVNRSCMEAAGEPVIVYGDFASGPRTEEGGGGPTRRVIHKNDLFILDFSVVIHGYRADFANTFVVGGGEPPKRQSAMAAVCLEALQAGEAALGPNIPARHVHRVVHHVFRKHGMDPLFLHHTGHGLGLGHPDPPYLVPDSEDTLVIGDIITLEPGLYERGIGGMRFERNYLITGQGAEKLSHHHIGLRQEERQ